jgi:ferredoxin
MQVALMAPTEILAEQHYLGLTHMLDDLFISSDLLKGSQTAAEKRAAKADPVACRKCGICAGECPAKAITLPAYSDEGLLVQLDPQRRSHA